MKPATGNINGKNEMQKKDRTDCDSREHGSITAIIWLHLHCWTVMVGKWHKIGTLAATDKYSLLAMA